MNIENKIYPFKFLDSYTENDKEFFFGREDEIETLYAMTFKTNLIVVYGESGTGKTSIVKCGLFNRFQSHEWFSILIRRGENINFSLTKNLTEITYIHPSNEQSWLNEINESEGIGPETENTFQDQLKNIYLNNFKPIYLIFDQFEELYILGDKEEQNLFLQTLKEILLVPQPIKIIIIIREEYLANLYEFEKEIPQILRKKLRIEPMGNEKVLQIIKGINSYENSKVVFNKDEEEKIADEIFRKVKSKKSTIDLPYFQLFIDSLCKKNDPHLNNEVININFDSVKASSNLDLMREFLLDTVEKISFEKNILEDKLWVILSQFISLEGTKKPNTLDEITTTTRLDTLFVNYLLESFINKRILIKNNEGQYEIAHDSLAIYIAENRSKEELDLLKSKKIIENHLVLDLLFSENELFFIDVYIAQRQTDSKVVDLIERSKKAIEEKKKTDEIIKAETESLRLAKIADEAKMRIQEMQIKEFETIVALDNEIKLKVEAENAKNDLEKEKSRVELVLMQVEIEKNTALEAKLVAEEAEKKANKSKNSTRKVLLIMSILASFLIYIIFQNYKNTKKIEKFITVLDLKNNKYVVVQDSNSKYYYLNKDGENAFKSKVFDNASPFNIVYGFKYADVSLGYKEYLIDSSGILYLTARIEQELNPDSTIKIIWDDKTQNFTKLFSCHKVEHLKLNSTNFSSMDTLLDSLSLLKVVDLQRNNIRKIPKNINKLVNLKTLNIAYNSIDTVSNEIFELNSLEKLNLSYNKIKNIQIKNISNNLMQLDLSNNPINFNTLKLIKTKIQKCQIIFNYGDSIYVDKNKMNSKSYLRGYQWAEFATQNNPQNSSFWYSLSYYSLFEGKYDIAIDAVSKSYSIVKDSSIEANLALAYLLKGDWQESEKIYKHWKGKTFQDGRNCNELFLQDIKNLENSKLPQFQTEKVKNDFQKARNLLKENSNDKKK